jgi:hypothetical protein
MEFFEEVDVLGDIEVFFLNVLDSVKRISLFEPHKPIQVTFVGKMLRWYPKILR